MSTTQELSRRSISDSAYLNFLPRRNQPERFDEQKAFLDSETTGVTWLLGGNGSGTTTMGLLKAVIFMLEKQPPPRKDTPFWIIGNTLEQIITVAWNEKLHGKQILPDAAINWRRISWYNRTMGMPRKVALNPWPTRLGGDPHKNWLIEFKSYDQGQDAMMANAIGGFLFVEQFPYALLSEVLRGCREDDFRGNKICEFTPVDPTLCTEFERMMRKGTLPETWEVYRCNTQCAMEQGQVSEDWFVQFFGSVPEDMYDTRMTGDWPLFEGMIYKEFNDRFHIVPEEEIELPTYGAIYHRGVDWGTGPSNAFAAVFAYRRGDQWTIFDEYTSNEEVDVFTHLERVHMKHPWPTDPDPWYGASYADPAGSQELRLASQISRYKPGMPNMPFLRARNAVKEGIHHMKSLFGRVLTAPDGSKMPAIRISDKCTDLITYLRSYRWLYPTMNSNNPRDAPPEPLKKDDHLPDALRYMIYSEACYRGVTAEHIRADLNPLATNIKANLRSNRRSVKREHQNPLMRSQTPNGHLSKFGRHQN